MRNKYISAALLGLIAGMRSLSAPALVSAELSKTRSLKTDSRLVGFFKIGIFAMALRVLAIGEFFGDKLPAVPDRIKPLPLIARTLSGAVCGAAICSEDENSSTWGGALIGAAAAIASSFISFHLRRTVVTKLKAPDTVVAFVEDGLVVAAGRLIDK